MRVLDYTLRIYRRGIISFWQRRGQPKVPNIVSHATATATARTDRFPPTEGAAAFESSYRVRASRMISTMAYLTRKYIAYEARCLDEALLLGHIA